MNPMKKITNKMMKAQIEIFKNSLLPDGFGSDSIIYIRILMDMLDVYFEDREEEE